MSSSPARRFVALLALASVALGGQRQAETPSPGVAGSVPTERPSLAPPPARGGERLVAVLLADAALRDDPDDSSAVVSRLPAGTVLPFIAEVTDVYGRRWARVGDPGRLERQNDRFVAPFDSAPWDRFGPEVAVLEMPALPPASAQAAATASRGAPPWWRRTAVIRPEHSPLFGGVVGVDAAALSPEMAAELIELVGGVDALGPFPDEPIPGQLHVPSFLPIVLLWDGERWAVAEPPRFVGREPSLVSNPGLSVDADRPQLATGPQLACWSLERALDPAGLVLGSVAVAPPVSPVPTAGASNRQTRPVITDWRPLVVPAAGAGTAVPPRLPGRPAAVGVVLGDETNETAVHLRQALDPLLVERLRGRAMVLEARIRVPPRAGSATASIAVRSGGEIFVASGSAGEETTALTLEFTVPETAEDLSVHLLPVDYSIALEQQGRVVFERVTLRPASWPARLPAEIVVLHGVSTVGFRPTPRVTRAPVAVTGRSPGEAAETWAAIADRDLDLETVRSILAGEVRPGMPQPEVLAAWGEPDRRVGGEQLVGLEARWDYDDGRSAVFAAGRLLTFSRATDPGPAAPSLCFTPSAAGAAGGR